MTEHKAAVKIMSWQKIRELRHIEVPQKEVAAMQFVSREGVHPHVMGTLDVLQDDEYLLMFMPFCSSGDLFGFVQQAGRFPEPMARYWFRQILDVSLLLLYICVCVFCTLDPWWFVVTNSFVLLLLLSLSFVGNDDAQWCYLSLSVGHLSFAENGCLSSRHVVGKHSGGRVQDIGGD